jgi:TPR repeat protein
LSSGRVSRKPFAVIFARAVTYRERDRTFRVRVLVVPALWFLLLGCGGAAEPPAAVKATPSPPREAAEEPLFTQGNASCDKRMGPALAKQATVRGKLGLYVRACDLGCAPACDGAGTLLRSGPTELRDAEQAAEHYERACAGQCARGCIHLGELHERPRTGAPDERAAEDAYRRACDLKDGDGCAALGELLLARGGDPAAAVAEYRRGCALDGGRACARLAALHEVGQGVELDQARALDLYEHACEESAALGCAGAARMLARTSDEVGQRRFEQKAAELDAQGCNDGDAAACVELADAYRDGRGVEQDMKRAARFYAVGCEEGVEVACEGLKRLPAETDH